MTMPISETVVGPPPPLTLLYAPADRPERFAKALHSGADAVIFDLEDAVAPDHKDQARKNLAELFASGPEAINLPAGVQLQVRINAQGSPWMDHDLDLIQTLPPEVGVRIPKAEFVSSIIDIAQKLGERDLFLLLESALGIENAFALATASPQVKGISLGEADLRSQLGITGDRGLDYARSRAVYVAAAAGLNPPAMAVFASVTDSEGLAKSCQEGKALGMFGRTAIHPRQLATIRSAFLPSPDEVVRAQEIVSRMRTANQAGTGTVVLDDGTFLDIAMVEKARKIVAISARAR